MRSSLLATSRLRMGLAALSAILIVTALAGTTVLRAGSSQAAAGLGANWYGAAPYDMPLDNSPPDLGQVLAATGQKAYTLAFVLAQNNSACAPAWDGGAATVSAGDAVAGQISALRGAGGDVSVSFGGYGGTKLGQVCGSASATAAAEQQVVNAYGLHALDFDLEEPEIENSAAIANELGAAQILQRDNPGLYVSITIPSTTSGANYFGQQLLSQAHSIGFVPDNFSIMPFDGGFSGAASQITALQDFNAQLMSVYGWSSATAYGHEGVSSMNGRTDSAEYFYQSDFQQVLSFAENAGMSRYTFWSANRDRECNPPDNNGSLSGTCSSVPQNDWDFTRFTTQFAGAVPPPPSPTPTPTPTPPPGGGCQAAAWNSGTAYVSGDVVSYNGHKWTANQWNYNEVPGGPAGAWNDDGPC
jgi:chitinase